MGKEEKKPLFELPKLISLGGEEITEEILDDEGKAGNQCLVGTGKTCTGGN